MPTIEEINQAVFDALNEHHSIRILGDLPTEFLNEEDYIGSTMELIKDFVDVWKEKAKTLFVAVEVWPRHSYFALDLNNDRYNYDTAHIEIIRLPVYLLRLSRRSRKWKIFRHRPEDRGLAERIAFLHEGNGQAPTPFLGDHIKGVVHLSPRRLGCPNPLGD
ncbi:hypothetical protein L228DRAFT_266638 [Xylona heveae TC161]|uniref:Uncharacterized protein n=1 Tax=Xylona heveae (strain CBS 132557 / TC161) TaxID=1328760 RepID=A0A165I2U2_XYLHT|nr:hypothetical protein L228DRAFT_266638 [Xylona heveae TC161]KZF24292.1 hypothetical protein L228DRAFT_266638 [Xylona heveae TC161]